MSRTTRVARLVPARAREVYRAFVDPALFASWLPPDGMRGSVHTFEPHVGGRIRMSLTYVDRSPGDVGKSSDDTDTFAGSFAALDPERRVVHVVDFESEKPEMRGTMRIVWDLRDAGLETEVTCTCEGIPAGIALADNERGTAMSLDHLAALFES